MYKILGVELVFESPISLLGFSLGESPGGEVVLSFVYRLFARRLRFTIKNFRFFFFLF